MDIWYEQLGFIDNPFSIKPGAYDDELFGYANEIKKVYSAMNNGGVWFIEGNFGVGKTSMLKQIINSFKGRKRVIYFSANRSEGGINFKTLLLNRNGFFQRVFGILPKNMILLLDEAHKINAKDATNIEKLMKSNHFKTVVYSSDKVEDVQMTPWLKKKMGDKRVLKIQPITEASAIKLVRNRVGDLKLLPNNAIKSIFEKSNYNPRRMLENLEDVCRYAMDIGAKKITDVHVKKVIK